MLRVTTVLKLIAPQGGGGYSYKKVLVFFWLMIWSCCSTPVSQGGGRYRCMLKDFIRLGNSCYFLSAEIASWQEAHFRCRDRGSQLAVLASHYEDSTLRNYLERPEFAQLGRWIGGMWAGGKWIWAAQGTEIETERSFVSEQAYDLGESDQWMCLYMDPRNRYHWNNNNCMHQSHYICEAPLARESNSSAANDDASPAGSSEGTTTEQPIITSTIISMETDTSTTDVTSNGQTHDDAVADSSTNNVNKSDENAIEQEASSSEDSLATTQHVHMDQ